MDEYRQHLLFATGAVEAVARPALALHYGINRFQMTRIGSDGQMNAAAVGIPAVGGEAFVVFDVPFANKGEFLGVGKFGENIGQRFTENGGQHVDATAVGHAQHQIAYAPSGSLVHQVVEHRDDGLAPLQGKTLLADELAVQKELEEGGFLQFLQNGQLLVAARGGAVANRLHAIFQPLAFGRILDVHELDAEGPAVGILQGFENLPEAGARLVETSGVEDRVEVALAQTEGLQGQLGMPGGAGGERVGAGLQVAHVAIAVDQGLDRGLLEGSLRRGSGGRAGSRFPLSQGEPFKKYPPFKRDLGRRFFPEQVLGLDELGSEITGEAHG